jgi:hypothetical protein
MCEMTREWCYCEVVVSWCAAALLDHETLKAGQIKVRHVCLLYRMAREWLLWVVLSMCCSAA